jgi:PHD/YefM family antitoxin component YafN of YafNO toxin-antitoxin module
MQRIHPPNDDEHLTLLGKTEGNKLSTLKEILFNTDTRACVLRLPKSVHRCDRSNGSDWSLWIRGVDRGRVRCFWLLHKWVDVCTIAGMSIRMPISTGSRKGLSSVVTAAEKERIVLTSHGRAVAVVDSAERLDEDLRRLRVAADAVIEYATSSAAERSPKRLDLNDVCARLGIDPAEVRERALDT